MLGSKSGRTMFVAGIVNLTTVLITFLNIPKIHFAPIFTIHFAPISGLCVALYSCATIGVFWKNIFPFYSDYILPIQCCAKRANRCRLDIYGMTSHGESTYTTHEKNCRANPQTIQNLPSGAPEQASCADTQPQKKKLHAAVWAAARRGDASGHQ